MTTPELNEPASSRQLLRGTLTALLVAAILLVAVVLPAEYGVDPTGIGKTLGLHRPHVEPVTAPGPAAAVELPADGGTRPKDSVFKSQVPFRSDETSLVLQPGEGAEIKAVMSQGERLVFGWTTEGGSVDVDMHGEKVGATEGEFTSYWKDSAQPSAHGAFEAPFAGTHGWYWQNIGSAPVTVKVKTSGYYQKLFRP